MTIFSLLTPSPIYLIITTLLLSIIESLSLFYSSIIILPISNLLLIKFTISISSKGYYNSFLKITFIIKILIIIITITIIIIMIIIMI
jgi:hypothetical protein